MSFRHLLMIAAAGLALASPLAAQERAVPAADETRIADSATIDEQHRAELVALLDHRQVVRVARFAGVDLSEARSHALALDGEQLARAARQARAIDGRLDEVFSLRVSTIVIALILGLILFIT